MLPIRLCDADDLRPGDVRAFEIDDLELVAWRGHDGIVCVMDARCPHQFSHLAAEGVVDGDEIVCSSHLWRLARDGSASILSRGGRREPMRSTTVYPCEVRDGVLYTSV